LVARQLGAVARYEVEHAVERQKAAKLQAAKSGKYGGGKRPYAYAKDGVTIVPQERDVLLEMAERIIRGESYRSIALDLNRRGIAHQRRRAVAGVEDTGRGVPQTQLRPPRTSGHGLPRRMAILRSKNSAASGGSTCLKAS
jgi:hypothetical protein